jgi:hypothetical protein
MKSHLALILPANTVRIIKFKATAFKYIAFAQCNIIRGIAIYRNLNFCCVSTAICQGNRCIVAAVGIAGRCDVGCTCIATPAGRKRAAASKLIPIIRWASP